MIDPDKEPQRGRCVVKSMLLDFFKDCSLNFKGRVDEGNISLKEMNDFISKWVDKHFN